MYKPINYGTVFFSISPFDCVLDKKLICNSKKFTLFICNIQCSHRYNMLRQNLFQIISGETFYVHTHQLWDVFFHFLLLIACSIKNLITNSEKFMICRPIFVILLRKFLIACSIMKMDTSITFIDAIHVKNPIFLSFNGAFTFYVDKVEGGRIFPNVHASA